MHCTSCEQLTPLGYAAGLGLLFVLVVALPRAPEEPPTQRDGLISFAIERPGAPASDLSLRDDWTHQHRRSLVLQMRR